MACLKGRIPGMDTISNSLHKTLDYAEELRTAVVEPEGSNADGFRNQAEWSRMIADEMRKQEMPAPASASIKAENSLEQMLAYQLAMTHKNAVEQVRRVHGASPPGEEIKRLNVAARLMSVFQQGLLTLKKLRQGQRKITLQYVNVSGGSQAVIGNVATGDK